MSEKPIHEELRALAGKMRLPRQNGTGESPFIDYRDKECSDQLLALAALARVAEGK